MAWNVFFVFIFSVCVVKSMEGYYQPPRGSAVWGYFTPPLLQRVPSQSHQTAMEAMVELTNNLGVAILQDHSFSRGNFAFSPYGVASVLVVLYEGARSESARQIHRAVRFPLDKDIIRVGFRDIHRHLRSYFSHEGYLSGISLNKQSSSLREEYKQILKFYGYDVDLNSSSSDDDVNSGNNTSEAPPTEASTNKTTDSPTQPPTTEVSIGDVDKNTTNVSEKEDENMTTQSAILTTQPPPTEYPLNSTTVTPPAPSTTDANLAQNLTESFGIETKETTKPHIKETEPVQTTTGTPETIPATTTTTATPTIVPEITTTATTTTVPETVTTSIPTTVQPVTTTAATTTVSETITTTATPTTVSETITTSAPTTVPPITTTTTAATPNTITPARETTTVISEKTPITSTLPPTTAELSGVNPQDETTIEDENDEFQINITVDSRTNNAENGLVWNKTEETTTQFETISLPENKTEKGVEEITNNSLDNGMLIPQQDGIETTTIDSLKTLNDSKIENIKDLINSRAILWLETGPKKRKSRTITDYLKSPHNLDLSLQLQNGMYDTHVSRNADLYRKLPRLLFLVDGAVDTPVPMMIYTNVFSYAYIPRLHSKALEFPLDDIRYKLLIILPVERRGLRQLIYDLADYPLSNVLKSVRPARVKATVPTFMVEGFVILTSSLQKLGIWDVFDPRKANLSGMSTDPELYVRNVEQSVTVVIRNYVEILDIQTRTMAARQLEYEFEATHPFLYFVLDTDTNVALMAGQILDPLNSRIY